MRGSMHVKAIVVDLDRTLLRTDKTLSPYTVHVLKECKKHMRILVATARPLRTAKQYGEAIGADGMVVSNGARIICAERWTECGISQRSGVQLLSFLSRYPSLLVTLETGDIAYSNRPIPDYETVVSDDLVGIAKTQGILKILVRLDNEETLAIVQEALTDDLYYTVAHGHLIQIMSKAATKWNGVKAMLEICGCTPAEVVYFGDDQDDIVPIQMCGMGIAVSNAIDEVKSVADYITQSNDADGVARFIEQMI